MPALPDLVKGADEGPMDLLRWVAHMLFKSPRPSSIFFSVSGSHAVVRFAAKNDFVLNMGLGGGEQTFVITWMGDPELVRLSEALRGQGVEPSQIQGLSLVDDPRRNRFKG